MMASGGIVSAFGRDGDSLAVIVSKMIVTVAVNVV